MDTFSTPSRDETLLIFAIHGIRCAVPAQSVATIVMPPRQVAHLPGSNRTRPGIFAHNGLVHGVVDLREAFGLGDGAAGGRLLLYHVGAHHYAFAVDEVVGLVRSEEGQWAPLPPDLPRKTFTRGFLHQRDIVLCSDFPRLLRLEDGEPLRRHFASRLAAHFPAPTPTPRPDAPTASIAPAPPSAGTPRPSSPYPRPRADSAANAPPVAAPPVASRAAAQPRPISQRATPPSSAPRREVAPAPRHRVVPRVESQLPPTPPAPATTAPSSHPLLLTLLLGLLTLAAGWWLWPEDAPEAEPPQLPVAVPAATPVTSAAAPPAPPRQPLRLERGGDGVTLIVEESALTSPAATELAPPSPREERRILHRVRKGETLWGIAERYVHDPWRFRELARQSGIDNPHLIYPGDQVTIVIR